MHSVKSEPVFAPLDEAESRLTLKQLTKPRKNIEVIKANDYMKRNLGVGSYFVESPGSIFNVNEFEEALKNFQR